MSGNCWVTAVYAASVLDVVDAVRVLWNAPIGKRLQLFCSGASQEFCAGPGGERRRSVGLQRSRGRADRFDYDSFELPIHLHLVRFQTLDRRRFDSLVYKMTGQLRYTGPAEPPEPSEAGWKDTVRAHSSIVRFEGFVGRYVWHCDVLEHEDNEMMRPYDVLLSAGQ